MIAVFDGTCADCYANPVTREQLIEVGRVAFPDQGEAAMATVAEAYIEQGRKQGIE